MMRKRTLEYDDVMNKQREKIYGFRSEALQNEDTREQLYYAVEEIVATRADDAVADKGTGIHEFISWANTTLPLGRREKELPDDTFLYYAREIAYAHHEKWDGSGYPQGLAGDEIPFSGRLMALADVYDALISKRVYKPPFPHEKAVSIITEGRGTHFDPDMVDAFLVLEETFRQIAIEFADFEEERENLRNTSGV